MTAGLNAMSDDIAAPVNGIIKAFHKGTERSTKICTLAGRNATAARVLHTVEPAQALQKSLAESEAELRYAYFESIRVVGKQYASAIQNDPGTSGALKDLTISLQEQLGTLSDYIEDPDTFDLGSFSMIRRDSERCRRQAVDILGALHQRMLSLQQSKMPIQGDRAQLSSQRQSSGAARPQPQISPMQTVAPQSFTSRVSAEETPKVTRISFPSHYDVNRPSEVNIPTGTSYGSYKEEDNLATTTARSSHRPREDSGVQLIERAEVVRQMTSNEDFLEKRKRSRQSFRQGMDDLRQSSMGSSTAASPRPGLQTSPHLVYTDEFSASPVITSRPNSYYLMARAQTREVSTESLPNGRSPRDSDAILERQDSSTSELLIFGQPESPSQSGTKSTTESHKSFSTTLNPPGFGDGVEDGIQVVGQRESDEGLILANETKSRPECVVVERSVGYPMRRDTSFHKHKGFCPGAHMIRRGTKGAQEVRKKPGAHLAALISVKCIKCKYEISWDVYDKDNFLDRDGIYTIGDIRFRQRFLSKCHMPAEKTDDSAYACIFCVDEGKTVDDYDATVFFSLKQFFRHLEKHRRPLKPIEGIVVVYNQPEAVDFDIDFMTLEPKCSPHANIDGTFRDHPTAHATLDHLERGHKFQKKDPQGRQTLQFASGARIVGVTYSERLHGAWCFGYHDGDKGYFPASAIALDLPSIADAPTKKKSTLFATARWDHKPKDRADQYGWLTFKKGDKITDIDFKSQDAWCWSGCHKGNWGFFPACFVEGLKEGTALGQPITSPGRHNSGDVSPKAHAGFGSFIRRRTTASSATSS